MDEYTFEQRAGWWCYGMPRGQQSMLTSYIAYMMSFNTPGQLQSLEAWWASMHTRLQRIEV